MKKINDDNEYVQKIVIISRASELKKEPYYREIIEKPAKYDTHHLMRFIVEELVRNKGPRNNHDNVMYINGLIDKEAPQAKDSIYRTDNNTIRYIDSLVKYLENLCEKKNPYRIFMKDNKQFFLLLWDKLSIVPPGFISKEKENRLSLIQNICKDFGLQPDRDNSGNILYIHDEEWGIKKNVQLYTQVTKGDDINEHEYSEMKRYFVSAIAFQHISVDTDITVYDLIRHGIFDSSKIDRVNEIDEMLESGKSFKNILLHYKRK